MICEKCGHTLQVGDYPFCEKDGGHLPGGNSVVGDDIPGGLVIDHFSSTPMKFYSKSAIAAEAKRRGLVSIVEHVGERGSDKSPHTTRWY